VFVAVDPVRQALGRVTTVEAALEASGAAAERRVLEFGFEPASAAVAASLALEPGPRCCASAGSRSPTAHPSRS